MAIDGGWVVLAVLVAYVARFEAVPQGTYGRQLAWMAAIWPGVRWIVWRAFGVYAQSWRMFALSEAATLSIATAAASLGLLALRLGLPFWPDATWTPVPLGVIVLEGLITLLGTTFLRVGVRLRDETSARSASRARVRADSPRRRALLVGAGRSGRQVARELAARPDLGYHVVGFLDDDADRHGQTLEGARVLGATADAEIVAAATEAQVLILTMPSATRGQLRAVVDRCSRARLPVRTVPAFYEVLGDHLEITKIRPLRIEDLLGREVIAVDAQRWEGLREMLRGRAVLVTGAGGSIGSELCRQLMTLELGMLVLVENNENNLFEIEEEIRLRGQVRGYLVDVRDPVALDRVFSQHRPAVVFHAAAFKHVPMMENHPAAAIDNNVLGTLGVVEAAQRHQVERFLLVSTDKAVHPANVMGASKRIAEMIVQAHAHQGTTKFCCVRFGNVLGSRGSVFHTFRRQIEEGGPVTVTHPEVTRFFMTIPEAVRLVIQAAMISQGGEVFQLDMGEPVKIIDLARQMIALAGASSEEVPIRFVGLRPGEKLNEELWHEDEGASTVAVDGIYLAKPAPVDLSSVRLFVDTLRRAALADDREAIRRGLRELTGYRQVLSDGQQV